MFHTKNTITIGRLARLIDTRELRLVKRFPIWVPRVLLLKAYARLTTEVAETLNRSALEQEIQSGVLRAKVYNKAFNLYPALVNLVSLTWDEKHLAMIEELTGLKLKKLEDRKALNVEMRRLQDKYKELAKEERSDGEVSFSQVIVSTEIVLELSISRETTLSEFQYYMKAASEKLKQYEKLNERHQ